MVTDSHFNLYSDILKRICHSAPPLNPGEPCIYIVTIRSRPRPNKSSLFDFWHYPLTVGKPIPTLPIWLDLDLSIPLPLESSYEETCRLLHIA